ncbi:hypothetical protein N7508_009901 [Penicillium antarcticum]|uniref:uncharacterized protein n=1 Tax=Penicillium antarcticum TaxID=416450 RepID=UPI002398DC5D|nr:uncharacterized protein N7508_009901 [Penicillium antarcticum]KAJ5295080.1 hypothetical protein N7508_009901 [Penicillium antarcticum]
MAPSHSFKLYLSLALSYLSPLVSAAPWIVTEIYQQDIVTESYGYGYPDEVTTQIEKITPTATLPAEALSTITSTETLGSYTVIEKLYPTGYGSAAPYDYAYGYHADSDGNIHSTIFKVNLVYTAPTGCSTKWTSTVEAEVTPPFEIRNDFPYETGTASTSVDDAQPFQPTTYFFDVIHVDPTQIPSYTLSSLSYYNAPTSVAGGASCQYTSTSDSTSSTSSGTSSGYYTGGYYGNGYYGYYDDDNWFTSKWGLGVGISGLAITLICVLGWIGLFLILGFIEAWVRFRRLMTGWQTRRGLPLFWCFLIFPITLFFLFCFRKGFRARSREDAEVLKKRWDAMPFGTKLKLYFLWGFRFKYPPVLGPAPARVQGSKKPKESGPRLLDATPPGSSAGSGAERGLAGVPEVGEVQGQQGHVVPRSHDAVPDVEASGAVSRQRDEEIGHAR